MDLLFKQLSKELSKSSSAYIFPGKNVSTKWFLNKEEHWTMIKPIFEIRDLYPNQVLSQAENKPNEEGGAKH